MSTQDFSRSNALNNIPKKKLLDWLSTIESSTDDLQAKTTKLIAINRYAESNIPIEYWSLKMERDFKGDPRLLVKYNEYISDLKSSYLNGTSICFAGPHGVGKSFCVTSILKKACQKGFSTLYSDLSSIVNVLTMASSEDKFLARRELTLVDFLVIDEFDSRFMPSDNAADLYARSLESVFRTRSQNKLPTLMCTNSPNVVESFNGPLKSSIDSLMKGYLKMFVVTGDDFRKKAK
ncbi:DnaC DNA replication protein [uncultured Caudovirales phage]|uniref:DnaC DNA replication protein n=1 Tax=uncultured Caudovirales phage TaxID=2100421 RepID=A0A6J5RKE3_9CAUD|nr:DnaC DNA replication protein [uncultured Caudovirales phage]